HVPTRKQGLDPFKSQRGECGPQLFHADLFMATHIDPAQKSYVLHKRFANAFSMIFCQVSSRFQNAQVANKQSPGCGWPRPSKTPPRQTSATNGTNARTYALTRFRVNG